MVGYRIVDLRLGQKRSKRFKSEPGEPLVTKCFMDAKLRYHAPIGNADRFDVPRIKGAFLR